MDGAPTASGHQTLGCPRAFANVSWTHVGGGADHRRGPCCVWTLIPSSRSNSSTNGHAPSAVFEITVAVIRRSGSCVLVNETPAS